MTATRRLAAIMVADVVGYSRLMAQDEAGTLAALKERRKTILEPVVKERGGRIIKGMGDGFLIEFASAVNAVEAAIELQRRMAEANAGVPQERSLMLRIGINLGDVIGEDEDVYGDGVNLAARLESLARPGGICLSAKVHEEVRGKIAAAFEDLGEQRLKNLGAPVRLFRIATGLESAGPRAPAADARPSIAVLPFTNMSGDAEQRYLSDGITEDIITELSRFRQLRVVARNSSFRYREPEVDAVRVGRELGVRYLVEGSLRRLGDRLRITAQLIDAETAHHVWAEKFDCKQDEIFDVQDRVVRTIVATLSGRLQAANIDAAKRKPPASLEAYECVLRADALPFDDAEGRAEARKLYEKAIALDPGYARAYALLSNLEHMDWEAGLNSDERYQERARELARRALALDDNDVACQLAAAWVYLFDRAHDLAERHVSKAVALNPNSPVVLAAAGAISTYLGKPELSIERHKEAKLLDPYFEPSWYWMSLGTANFQARRYDEAIDALGRSRRIPYWGHAYLAAAHAHAGRIDAARRHLAEADRLRPDWSPEKLAESEPFRLESDRAHLLDGLRKAASLS